MFNRAKRIFKIIKSGTEEELRAHLEKYPDSVKFKKDITRPNGRYYPICPVMFHAAYYKKIDMLPILKDAGAEVDAVHELNSSALNIVITFHNDGDKSYEDTIRCLAELGASTTMKNGKNAEDYAQSPEIKKIFNPEYVEPVDESTTRNTFVCENDHMVSYTENGEATGITIKTIFNFAQKNIITQIKDKDGQCAVKESFKNATNPQELQNAAKFLSEQNGDLCGFKLNIVN